MRTGLSGQVVLITGAARGIGAALAKRLATGGARVALIGLEGARLESLAATLGAGHVWAECDVTDGPSLERAVVHAVERLGGLDVVVANAGIAALGTVSATDADALVRVIDVNIGGVVRTVATTLPYVTERRGHYLLVASASSFLAAPGLAVYAATKSAVEHFGRSFSYEVAQKGITVGTVHPCWIDTDLVRDAQAEVSTFQEMVSRLPGPLGTITSVDACAEAMARAIERRARTTYVPRSLAPFAWARHALARPPFDLVMRTLSARLMPTLERESKGRVHAFGEHSAERQRSRAGVE